MAYFTQQNTDGFTDDQLASMNAAYRELLADYDADDPNLDDAKKQIGTDISDAIAITGAGGWGGATDIVAQVREWQEKRREG